MFGTDWWHEVVLYILLQLKTKAWESPCHPAVMGSWPTPGDTCLPYLPSGWVYFGVTGIIEGKKRHWANPRFYSFFVFGVHQGDEEVACIQDFPV